MHIALLIVVVFLSGFTSGLLGVGGGVILVPVFYYLCGLAMHKAIGTSIVLIAVTTMAGSAMHLRNGFVDYRTLMISSAFVIAGSIVGAYTLKFVPVDITRKVFAVLLFLISIKMFWGGRIL